jgi:hypothetical protein
MLGISDYEKWMRIGPLEIYFKLLRVMKNLSRIFTVCETRRAVKETLKVGNCDYRKHTRVLDLFLLYISSMWPSFVLLFLARILVSRVRWRIWRAVGESRLVDWFEFRSFVDWIHFKSIDWIGVRILKCSVPLLRLIGITFLVSEV